MDTASSNSLVLRLEILPPKARKAFDFLSHEEWLSESGWYLAGGTALALQAGHRKSVDLDFFTQNTDFSNDELLAHFLFVTDWSTDINEKNTVYGELYGAKVSFIAYPSFIPVEPPIIYGSIKILKPSDIAVMKVIAISQRGKKRDFIDLYWLIQHGENLKTILQKLKTQYPSVAHNYHHILKSLVYFADADTDPAPELNFEASWKDVKNYFINQIPFIMKNLIDLR